MTTREVENFGRNLRFVPSAYYEPASEAELLQIMQQHAGDRIRAIGSLHAWSPVAVGDEVIVSVRLLNDVQLCSPEDTISTGSAWVGAGIPIKHLISRLKRLGKTTPSLGLISEQTLAGATATGTHGSGRHCLSHYVQAVRLAHYNQDGQAVIDTIEGGDSLRAAQCGLGNLGIIVAIKVCCRDRYNIAEYWNSYETLDQVIAAQQDQPLQQFFFLPWKWAFLAQHRQESAQPTSKLHWLYRLYFYFAIDIGLHLILLTAGKLFNSKRMVQALFRTVLWRSIIPNWLVIGDSAKMLIMEHELFRHIETELFVTQENLAESLEFVKTTFCWAAGDLDELPEQFRQRVEQTGLMAELQSARGLYCHHYPICVRRIIPDQTLMSMTSGGSSDWYSISMISYHRISQRDGFYRTMLFLSRAMAAIFGARPHWGKHNPLSPDELFSLYPNCALYAQICREMDASGVFRNAWFDEVLKRFD